MSYFIHFVTFKMYGYPLGNLTLCLITMMIINFIMMIIIIIMIIIMIKIIIIITREERSRVLY